MWHPRGIDKIITNYIRIHLDTYNATAIQILSSLP